MSSTARAVGGSATAQWSEWVWDYYHRGRIYEHGKWEYDSKPRERSAYTAQPSQHNFHGKSWSRHETGNEDSYTRGPIGDPETGIEIWDAGTTSCSVALDSNRKVHKNDFFKPGRIFKVTWTEPPRVFTGSTTTTGHEVWSRNGDTYTAIRRFVIIPLKQGHDLVAPIHTYSGASQHFQPSLSSHSMIFQGNGSYPTTGERTVFTPLGIEEKPSLKSRFNYAKTYNVEHNVKIYSIGKVDEEKLQDEYSGKAYKVQLMDTIILEDENGNRFTCVQGYPPPVSKYPWRCCSEGRLTALNILSGLGMASAFIWLDKRMGLRQSSDVVNWLINTSENRIPDAVAVVLEKVPDMAIFGGFVIATAIFTAATFACLSRYRRKAQFVLSTMTFAFWALLCLMMGVNVEEVILICLPLGISFGILVKCLCEKGGSRHVVADEEARN